MPELVQTFKSKQKAESDNRKFLAGIQGIDLGKDDEEEARSFEDVKRKAMGINASADDIVSLQGSFASESGFGIGAGLGYFKE
jgi:hypothetical protein